MSQLEQPQTLQMKKPLPTFDADLQAPAPAGKIIFSVAPGLCAETIDFEIGSKAWTGNNIAVSHIVT